VNGGLQNRLYSALDADRRAVEQQSCGHHELLSPDGSLGGLLLMLLFIVTLAKGFSFVGSALHQASCQDTNYGFTVWALGASLFAQAVTCLSVSYFDQSFLFLYLALAGIGSARSATETTQPIESVSTTGDIAFPPEADRMRPTFAENKRLGHEDGEFLDPNADEICDPTKGDCNDGSN